MSSVVRLENVSKRFVLQHHKARSFQDAVVSFFQRREGATEEFWALKDVSFEVQAGETIGIVGENGSGKSTILKLVTRILDPTKGKVVVNGKVSALIELGAGFHPDLTGRENIYLNGSILGFSRKEMNRKFDEIVAFSELERFIDTPVKHYSSGMYMRLGFSVAISVEPDILIIDEVLSVGDEVFQRKCIDRIREFRRRGQTIILVSHGLQMVESLCDRAIWLHRGVIEGHGAAARVVRSYMADLQRHDEETRELSHQTDVSQHLPIVSPMGQREMGDVEVLDARMLSADGRERYSFRTGETVIVRVRYRSLSAVSPYSVGIGLRRNDGLLIHSSSQICDSVLEVSEAGDRFVDLTVDNLPLLAGTYDLVPTLRSLQNESAAVGVEELQCSFSVWSELDQTGIVTLPYSWLGQQGFETASPSEPADAKQLVYAVERGPNPSRSNAE